jgi:hypothetical protein
MFTNETSVLLLAFFEHEAMSFSLRERSNYVSKKERSGMNIWTLKKSMKVKI